MGVRMNNYLIFGIFSFSTLFYFFVFIAMTIFLFFTYTWLKETTKESIKNYINTNFYSHEEIDKRKNEKRNDLIFYRIFFIIFSCLFAFMLLKFSIQDYSNYHYIKNNNLQEIKVIKLDGKYYLDK